MEEKDIGTISNVNNLDEVTQILRVFLRKNAMVFSFPNLSKDSRRVLLWTGLFQHLQNKASTSIHKLCITALRILSRDKTDLDKVICEKWITVLTEKAGLYNIVDCEQESMVSLTIPEKEIAVEALKCLCNLTYNSDVAPALCAHTGIANGLVSRIRIYKENPFKNDIMLFDMKLLFILTAKRLDIRAKVKDELHGMDYLISCLNEIVMEATEVAEELGAVASNYNIDGINRCNLNENQHAIACEILKSLFNLLLRSGLEDDDAEEAQFLKLMPIIFALLCANTTSDEKLMELRSNVTNLLTSVPVKYYVYLTPELNKDETAEHVLEEKNMDPLHALTEFLQHRLVNSTNASMQYENLSPIMTVMNKCARGVREQRKYLRAVVLPPLRDVHRRPERGHTLRNQLCRLLTTPVTAVRDLVAEFLFVLCKEKVGRMVKYTGFGNAAGHLAQKGLLGGGIGQAYSSSSDDSDTEEYIEAQPHIDPVVGCTMPPRINPFEGMTEEQKEYEAMKLVNLFDKMVSGGGCVRPARVGPDGRPQPLDHVLELREHPPNRPQS